MVATRIERARIKLVLVSYTAGILVILLALVPVIVQARETVCLKSGFCLEAESHMISDGVLVVQRGQGTLQFPVDQVDSITAFPTVVAPATEPIVKSVPVETRNVAVSSEEILFRAALQEGLEPAFVRSVAMVESGLRQEVLSNKGAIGLMQLMPFTAMELGVNPQLAEQNALGGATFLRQLLIKYKGDSALALAAYNAGPGAVDKYRGVPPYFETRRYILKVLQEYARQQRLEAAKELQAQKAKVLENNLRAQRTPGPSKEGGDTTAAQP